MNREGNGAFRQLDGALRSRLNAYNDTLMDPIICRIIYVQDFVLEHQPKRLRLPDAMEPGFYTADRSRSGRSWEHGGFTPSKLRSHGF